MIYPQQNWKGSHGLHGFLSAPARTGVATLFLEDVSTIFFSILTTILDEPKLYPSNIMSNAKYNVFTFVPVILYEEVRYF
jgi:hypothetical protein